ncbi:MAG: hypothetical protein JW708_10890, partial [Vallitaleaceae bacterium]|nr:hypothetical protein [Vallitaleaceae bacterium]
MRYPGLAYIGSGEIAGLYGLNETIHDQKSYGLQHLYLDNYEVDYIYSALSVVELKNTCYYADHSKPKSGHPQKAKSKTTYSKDGFCLIDEFEYHHFRKKDSVYCASDRLLIFNTTIENKTDQVLAMKVSSFVVTTKIEFECSGKGDQILLEANGKKIRLLTQEKDVLVRVSKESPSGFMYKGIQNLMYEENQFVDESLRGNEGFVITQTVSIYLEPKQSYTFQWALSMEEKEVDFLKIESQGKSYWKQWLKKSPYEIPDTVIANLIALKAISLKGFIPADLTGHYFAGDQVCFYVRDALHGARAFLYSGFYEESKEIILLTKDLVRKKNHEMFQRYNSKLIPDEGANNNVFSQIDVIGYLLRVVADYEKITGDLVMDVESLIKETEVLDDVSMKNGLYGPEGGVNEGVYGPAFITSTNIFIVGGLLGLLEILRARKHPKRLKIETRIREMQKAIE